MGATIHKTVVYVVDSVKGYLGVQTCDNVSSKVCHEPCRCDQPYSSSDFDCVSEHPNEGCYIDGEHRITRGLNPRVTKSSCDSKITNNEQRTRLVLPIPNPQSPITETPSDEPEKTSREEMIKVTHLKIEVDATWVSGKLWRDADDPTVSTLLVVEKPSEFTVCSSKKHIEECPGCITLTPTLSHTINLRINLRAHRGPYTSNFTVCITSIFEETENEHKVTKKSGLPENSSTAMGENLVKVGAFHTVKVSDSVKLHPLNSKTEATLSKMEEHVESAYYGSNGATRPQEMHNKVCHNAHYLCGTKLKPERCANGPDCTGQVGAYLTGTGASTGSEDRCIDAITTVHYSCHPQKYHRKMKHSANPLCTCLVENEGPQFNATTSDKESVQAIPVTCTPDYDADTLHLICELVNTCDYTVLSGAIITSVESKIELGGHHIHLQVSEQPYASDECIVAETEKVSKVPGCELARKDRDVLPDYAVQLYVIVVMVCRKVSWNISRKMFPCPFRNVSMPHPKYKRAPTEI